MTDVENSTIHEEKETLEEEKIVEQYIAEEDKNKNRGSTFYTNYSQGKKLMRIKKL
jgi:hypothetical protein